MIRSKKGDKLIFEENGQKVVRKYRLSTIISHWIMIISVFALIFTGAITLINKIIDYINLFELTIPQVPYRESLHVIFGFFLLFGALFVIFTRTIDLKEIMFGKFIRSFGGFFRSILYIIGFDKRLESGDIKKFYAYQRMSFVLIGFALWILILSGIVLFINASPDSSINQTFIGSVRMLHMIGALLIILLMLYHIVIIIRRFDRLAVRCMFIDGKLPLWYVKKNHHLWYQELLEMERK